MQYILNANKNILALLNKQKFSAESNYRLNHFVVAMHIEKDYVLYNNMTKSMIVLDHDEEEQLNKFLAGQSENITGIIKTLIEQWFFVKDDFNEVKVFDQVKSVYLEISNSYEDNTVQNFTILSTTNCNARCYYCYEAGVKKVNMSEETANDVADYIIKNLKKAKKDKTHIAWFGGEPLLGTKAIDIICNNLKDNKIDFSSSMTSNGYLMDKQNIKRAVKDWHLKKIQITLDGTEEVYNKTKAYVVKAAEKSPFETVIDNIEQMVKNKIYVSIRLNVSKDNYEDLKNLIYYLSERYKNLKSKNKHQRGYLSVYTHSIFQEIVSGYDEYDNNKDLLNKCYERELDLERIIEKEGLQLVNKVDTQIALNHCMADSGKCAVISPNGELCVCEHFNEIKDNYGSIYNDNINEEMIKKWKELYPLQESCFTCPYYPNCIRIVNCPNSLKDCAEKEQELFIYKLKKQIENTYYSFKK